MFRVRSIAVAGVAAAALTVGLSTAADAASVVPGPGESTSMNGCSVDYNVARGNANQMEASLIAQGVRVYGPGGSVSLPTVQVLPIGNTWCPRMW